jgi:hypothetical protein
MPQLVNGTWVSDDGAYWWDGQRWMASSGVTSSSTVAGEAACQICRAAPARSATFTQHIGAIVVWMNRPTTGVFCRDCAIAIFRREMNLTLMTGWWGMLSFAILNPLTILSNLFQRARAGRLPAPVRSAAVFPPLDMGRPVLLRPGIIVPIVLAVLLVLAVALSGRG